MDTGSFVVFGPGAQPLKVGFHIYDTYMLPAGSLLQKVQGEVMLSNLFNIIKTKQNTLLNGKKL